MYKEFAAQLLEDEQYDDTTMRDEPMAAANEQAIITEPETAALLTDDEVLLPHYECFRF